MLPSYYKSYFKIYSINSISNTVCIFLGWHSLRYFLFSLSDFIFQPSGVEGLNLTSKESEEASDSNKVDFNPLGLTGAEKSALKVQK